MSSKSSKGAKKLKKFFTAKLPVSKRFKSLQSFVEAVDEAEASKTFLEHEGVILATIQERFQEVEAAAKKAGRIGSDFTGLINIFRSYLLYTSALPADIKRDGILNNLLERCLSVQSRLELRLLAVDLLALVISSRHPTPQFAIVLFSNLLDIEALSSDAFNRIDLTKQSNEPSPRDSIEVWSKILDLIKPDDRFPFWFGLISREFLSLFYPQANIWKEKSTNGWGKSTFANGCPAELQKVLLEKIYSWVESITISGSLWDPATAPLMMEICRQSCRLPITYSSTITTSIEIFRTWLLSDEASRNLVGDNMQIYWRSFLQNISQIFMMKSVGNDQLKAHTNLCNDALDIFGYLSFASTQQLEPETWKVLQETLLNSIVQMVSASSPTAINSITHTITDELFHSLFLFWLQSTITTPEMWLVLRDQLSPLTEWKQLVCQWKEKVMSLTLLLGSWLYQDRHKKKARDSVFGLQELEEEACKGLPPDHPIASISWTLDRLKNVWFIFLLVLGPVQKIQPATNYTIAVSCMSEVVEHLLLCEERLAPTDVPPIPLFEIFLPSLLEMVRMDDRERNRGHLIAFSTLCRLFCRPNIRNLPIQFLSHFYQNIKAGLSPSSHSSVVWVILRYSADIFTLGLPGSSILIPDYLNSVSRLFDTDTPIKPPQDVQLKALTVLASLISYHSRYPSGSIPLLNGSVSYAEIADLLAATLLKAVRNPDLHTGKCVHLALWCLAVLIWTDVHSPTPRLHVIRDSFQVLLENTKHKIPNISEAALEALSFLAPIQHRINEVDGSLRKLFGATLSNSVITLIERGKSTGDLLESVVISHYYTILEWLVSENSVLLDSRSIVDKIMKATEYGLLGQVVEDPDSLIKAASDSSTPIDPKKKKDTRKKAPVSKATGEQLVVIGGLLFDSLQKNPAHGSVKVREAAEVFLLTLLTHYNNFPTVAGTEQISSWTSPKDIDESGPDLLYFIWNGSTILSFQEVDGNSGFPYVRITARTYTGKYVWDLSLDYEGPAKNRARSRMTQLLSSTSPSSSSSSTDTSSSSSSSSISPSSSSSAQTLALPAFTLPTGATPAYRAGFNYDNTDMLLQSLRWLETNHPETRPSDSIYFSQPYSPSSGVAAAIEFSCGQIQNQIQTENQHISTLDLSQRLPFPIKPESPTPISALHHCRLFLSHIGFLTPESRQTLHFLDNNARFKRSLKELDKLGGREVMKIGVIYVKPGQEDQHSILANDTRSPKFARFLAGLGWEVNLATHAGFMGGLDRKSTTGYSAPYYCDALFEVIFHDITRMPTHCDDPQQIHKKRHVGNDIVHIVWSEHSRLYRPSTITSQFNDVHIIIYPLPNDLYRISIQQKDNIGLFGPLQDGMILTEDLLGPLVRTTAINANRVVRKLQEVYRKPFPIRAYHIREINQRYKVDKPFDTFLGTLFPPVISDVSQRKHIDDLPDSAVRASRLSELAAKSQLPTNSDSS